MTDDLERSLSQALMERADVDRAGILSLLDSVATLPDRRAAGRGAGRLVSAAAVIVAIAILGVSIGLSDKFAATPALTPAPMGTPVAATATPAPVAAIDEDSMFRLTLTSTRSSRAPGSPIDVLASLSYLGPEASLSAYSGDRLVYFRAQRDGDPQIGGPWVAPCFAFPMAKGKPVEYRLTGAVPGFENLADSSLRLPAGIWHIRATAAPSLNTCGPDTHSLAAEITIEVAGP